MKAKKKGILKSLLRRNERDRQFQMGPDLAGDLRSHRPYFLVPLTLDLNNPETRSVRGRIKAWVQGLAIDNKPITDVFVQSHGWHRNFFSAVSAYDRIASRLAALLHTHRIKPPDRFNPLFLNLHWHSDPGENQWFDKSGRRHKASFMENVENAFVRSHPDFTRDFEYIFELFSSMSSPGVGALTDMEIEDQSCMLAERLDTYELREGHLPRPIEAASSTESLGSTTAGRASQNEKVSTVWTCYFEAEAKRVLRDQEEPPSRYIGLVGALQTVLRFAVGVLGFGVVANLLFNLRLPGIGTVAESLRESWDWLVARAGDWTGSLPVLGALDGQQVLLLVFIPIVAVVVLLLFIAVRWADSESRPARRSLSLVAKLVSFLLVFAWGYLQVLLSLPLLIYVVLAFLTGGFLGIVLSAVMAWVLSQPLGLGWTNGLPIGLIVGGVLAHGAGNLSGRWRLGSFRAFDERIGARDERPVLDRAHRATVKLSISHGLAYLARIPIRLVRRAIRTDSRLLTIIDALDSQLAFWEMQRLAVWVGEEAGQFIAGLLEQVPELKDARIHLSAHSFGALVVANAARHLAFRPGFGKHVSTLTILQGALSSDWFEGEHTLRRSINSTVASIYSRYDTANGFFYPLANYGRVATGHRGITQSQDYDVEFGGKHPSLVRPPNLGYRPPQDEPRMINLDASRLIYAGPVAVGGGHNDIFKDDIIHLLWSVSNLSMGE